MFQKLIVTGFQRHRKITLELDKEVTTIVGPSDVGKSSLLRAIRLVCLNRPQGDGYINKDAKFASVKLKVEGKIVKRVRGEGVNLYSIDGKEFRAFGNDIPQEMKDLLRVDEASFQMQADSHFWFGQSGGEVSKSLNEVVNLDSIDRVLTHTKEEVRSAAQEEFLTNQQVEAFREQRKKLLWVVKFDKDLQELESKETAIDSKRVLLASLRRMTTEARRHVHTLGDATDAMLAGESVLTVGRVALATKTTREYLANLIRQAKQAEKLSAVEVPDISIVLAARKQGDIVAELRRTLEDLVSQSRVLKTRLKKHTENLAEAEQELLEQSKKAKLCPTCGQKVKHRSPCASPSRTYTCGKRYQ